MALKIYTEAPIKSVWTWLGRLASIEESRKLLTEQPPKVALTTEQESERARSLAFAIRTARDYFHPSPEENPTESCLSYYYGLLSLVSALIIADESPPYSLAEIENETRLGHGIYNITDESQEFPKSELFYFRDRGFLRLANDVLDLGLTSYLIERRVDRVADLPRPEMAASLFELLIRVPELRKSTYHVWNVKRGNLHVYYSHPANSPWRNQNTISLEFGEELNFPDLDVDVILGVVPELRRAWLKELPPDKWSTRRIVAEVPLASEDEIPDFYNPPIMGSSFIEPLFGSHPEAPTIHFAVLYLLSIFVRYRPNLWRRVMEGDLDWFRSLIVEYLLVVERVIPNLFLNYLYRESFTFGPYI